MMSPVASPAVAAEPPAAHGGDQHTDRVLRAVDDSAGANADVGAMRIRDVTRGDDLARYVLNRVGRDGETDAVCSRAEGRVAAVSVGIPTTRPARSTQRTPAVAGIDGGTRLNRVGKRDAAGFRHRPIDGADDPLRDTALESERVSDREHDHADFQRCGVPRTPPGRGGP